MAYTTPTTQQISDTIVAQLQASLSQTIPLLPKAFTRVLAKVLSGVFAIHWRYAGWIFLQLFVRYASYDEVIIGTRRFRPLVEWGDLFGVSPRGEGTRAELLIAVTVTDQTGSLAAGTQLLRASTGVLYITTAAVALDAPTVNPTIRAVSDPDGNLGVGEIGNLEADDVVSFLNPVPNVVRDATVVSTSVTGADAEDVEVYRGRIVAHVSNRPQGGAYTDYKLWGEEPDGILHVYPYTSADPGEMDIYVESATETDGIPTQTQLDAVEASIIYDDGGLASRMPAGVELLNMYPITRTAFRVVVNGYDVSDDLDAECRAAITDACTEYFLDREPWILGLSPLPKRDRVTPGEVEGLVLGVVAAHGGTATSAAVQPGGGGTPYASPYILGDGEKTKLETVIYP
jgi:uncharacterized phage protein gp47/JayE